MYCCQPFRMRGLGASTAGLGCLDREHGLWPLSTRAAASYDGMWPGLSIARPSIPGRTASAPPARPLRPPLRPQPALCRHRCRMHRRPHLPAEPLLLRLPAPRLVPSAKSSDWNDTGRIHLGLVSDRPEESTGADSVGALASASAGRAAVAGAQRPPRCPGLRMRRCMPSGFRPHARPATAWPRHRPARSGAPRSCARRSPGPG